MARSGLKYWRSASFMAQRPCPDHPNGRCQMPKPHFDAFTRNLEQAGDLRRAGHVQAARNVLAAVRIVRVQRDRRLP